MRTTVVLDDDVVAAIEQVRRERDVRQSQVINELIRAGLRAKPQRPSFVQRSEPLGIHIDVTNVAEAHEILEGPDSH
ncbi:MAG TPA: CopG family transcriptional regulator [Candidatus Dormibacteraeota bacterium]|nr:CopG family transcriptional regulator [Candidatus Dormibacteraeota bacterium]